MHGKECDVEPNKEEPERDVPKCLRELFAIDQRKVVITSADNRKDGTAYQDVVQVRDDKKLSCA